MVEDDGHWPERYADVERRVRGALGDRVLALHHVGSTAVAGLPAKPVVDVDLAVADPTDESAYIPDLVAAGFHHILREPWWHEHRLLKVREPFTHLHVFGPDCPEVVRHTMFCDWLLSHDGDRERYVAAKRAASAATQRAGGTGMDYNRVKEPVVRAIYDRMFRAHGLLAPTKTETRRNTPAPVLVTPGMTVPMSPTITLHDGTSIPQLGLGVFQVPPEDTAGVVEQALEVGYRHIDTAQMYGNEAGVGAGLKASGVARDDVYLTSKLNNGFHRPDDARRTFGESLDRLGLDRIDLFLIHWPLPTEYDGDFVSTWRALAEFVEDGRASSIGVSNFQPAHLDRIVEETGVVPVVNQVEVHPYFGNESVREANRRHGVVTEAWSPLAQGAIGDDAAIGEIAAAHGKTPAQVVLRWHLQRGDIVFPKTTKVERMRENADVFDVELSDEQMATIDGLDRGEDGRRGPNPDTFDYIPD